MEKMQEDVDREWELLLKKEEFTKSLATPDPAP
jgi:hypothetical protein